MIPESEISQNPEHKVKPKLGNIFVNEKILEEYSDKIYKIDLLQVDKNRYGYILFRTDVYFTEYLLAVEIDEKNMLVENFFFEEKRQKVLEEKLCCKFIELIQVKKAMMQNIKLIEYKHSSVYLKTDN